LKNILYLWYLVVKGDLKMTADLKMTMEEEVVSSIEKRHDILSDLSDKIWDFAETRFEEFKSSEILCKVLTQEGFSIKKGIADMETAFIASHGSGKPVIGFLGEFDALYGLSQTANTAKKIPLVRGGKGHGCGHNGLGTGALAAAIAVKDYMKNNGIKGTVRYYGCPGEESGSGKVYITRAGYFKDLDVALTWHPADRNEVIPFSFLATSQVYFKFHGISSHAAVSPHLGRSALDAVELMDVGANYLREHLIQEARIHYAITNSGGLSPNVVQSETSVLYQIRAPKSGQVSEIYKRVVNIAKGAALMTGTKLEIVFDRGSSELIPNKVLGSLLYEEFKKIGPVPVDSEDLEFAKDIRKTLDEGEKLRSKSILEKIYDSEAGSIIDLILNKNIIDIIYPYKAVEFTYPGSTDVGDVSWNVPTAQVETVCYAKDTPGHSWQLVAQGKAELFHKGLLQAGKILASAAIKLFENPELISKAKDEFRNRLDGKSYKCPIPEEIKPMPKRA
jgi:aminobenzoyl-glutamate utilization protein B